MKSGVGTPLYMAPEVLIKVKVDIYSFSLIAYEVITGVEPIIENNILALIGNAPKGKRPDLSIIKNSKIQRPSFDQIVENFCCPDFYSSFEFEVNEVMDYVSLFPSDHPVLKKFLKQLENGSQIVEGNNHDNSPNDFKIVISVTGYNSIGNTTLIKSFVISDFNVYPQPTIGHEYSRLGNKKFF